MSKWKRWCLQNTYARVRFPLRPHKLPIYFGLSSYYGYYMDIDPRGGHNRRSFNHNIFNTWTCPMAYVLGFLFADGALIDANRSSRTCYVTISSKDKQIVYQIRQALGSKHNIYVRKPGLMYIRGKQYLRSSQYTLRIGSKKMFTDLANLGLQSRKSLVMTFPKVPDEYLSFFLRGYFDGDGCVYVGTSKGTLRINVIFTSGSENFLSALKNRLSHLLGLDTSLQFYEEHAYRLIYRNANGLKLLNYMYQNLTQAPYLERKYLKYQQFLNQKGV